MKLDLTVPAYELDSDNVFNFRENDWKEKLIPNITEMLKCGEKYGIVLKEISLNKPHKIDYSEIKKTITRILRLVITHGENKELDLTYDIPWLVDNHFYIGGNRKISIYQLFDKPLLCRGIVRLRTNIHSFSLLKKNKPRSKYSHYMNIFGKDIPFCYILYVYLGEDELKNRFFDDQIKNDPNYIDLVDDIKDLLEDQAIDKTRLLSSYFARKTDQEIIDNVLLITEIDIFSKQHMSTDNIIEELVYSLSQPLIDDCEYANKRLRFTEQLVYSYLCKDFYKMINSLKSGKKNARFHNNSKDILSNANQSSIVQFDFSLNPLDQIAMLSKISLTGPGGFDKGNVPSYLRDIHPSMVGRVCTADTGDRESCGTNQYLVPTVKLDDHNQFSQPSDNCVNSISISHVPFLEHDDPTRLQMSSSQQRHAIMLKEFDTPLIQSGIEGMYTRNSSFIFTAKDEGKVVFRDSKIIVIQYKNKSCKAFNITNKKLHQSIYDFYHVYYDVGQKFEKDAIIAESNYLRNGRLTIGKNLLTAIMVWHGYNYEDGIVISDKLVKDNSMTSVHFLDLSFDISASKILLNLNEENEEYKPLPNIGDQLNKGDIYAKVKTIQGFNDSNDVIFDDHQEKIVTEDCIITDVRIYTNKWNKQFGKYDEYVNNLIQSDKSDKDNLIETLGQYLTQDELENFMESVEIDKTEKKRRGTFKIKGDSIDGLRVEITAVYYRPITVGDKIGNRHGNKGIISAIVPHEKMPMLPDGRHAEVVINPLGIFARMNFGQLYELHLGMSVSDLKNNLYNKYNSNETFSKEDMKRYILDYISIIDKTENNNYSQQMELYLDSVTIEEFMDNINDFYIIQPPFESIGYEELDQAMKYTGTSYTYKCFDPISAKEQPKEFKSNIKNEIAFGYQYFVKMNHIAKDKIAARGVGPYAAKTCQPLDGKSRKGGQRVGEMEVWALAGHGAQENLWEILTTKSDSVRQRNKYISQAIHNDNMLLDDDDDNVSQSIRLLQAKLKSIGLDYPVIENE